MLKEAGLWDDPLADAGPDDLVLAARGRDPDAAIRAGLAALAELDPALPRYTAVAAYLHERDGDPVTAARLYAEAARSAPNLPERDHLTRQAARLNAQMRK
jgi:hypothetical protein